MENSLTIDTNKYNPKLRYATNNYIYRLDGYHSKFRDKYLIDIYITSRKSGYTRRFLNFNEHHNIPSIHTNVIKDLMEEFESKILIPFELQNIKGRF